jgi:hypothetical protein
VKKSDNICISLPLAVSEQFKKSTLLSDTPRTMTFAIQVPELYGKQKANREKLGLIMYRQIIQIYGL